MGSAPPREDRDRDGETGDESSITGDTMKAIAQHPTGLVLVYLGADETVVVDRAVRQWARVPDDIVDAVRTKAPWAPMTRDESDTIWTDLRNIIDSRLNRVPSINLSPVPLEPVDLCEDDLAPDLTPKTP